MKQNDGDALVIVISAGSTIESAIEQILEQASRYHDLVQLDFLETKADTVIVFRKG